MSLPRYPEYKDSGVDWLGAVPGHWEVKRLRFVAELNPSKSEIAELDKETPVSFLPMDAIGDDGKINLEYEKRIADVETGYTFFRDGDVTVAKITPCFENGKGAVMQGLTQGIGFGTTELIVARPIVSQTCSDYLHALFTSVEFRNNGEGYMYGAGGQKRVPDDFVRNFAIAFPPLEEQQTIAAFLDCETGKIDALIAEQQRLAELLAEKRQAVISLAVTKGLNPNARMKDSGIAWLGEVPKHWEVVPLKQVISQIESGVSVNASDFPATEPEPGVLKTSCVYSGQFDANENKTVIEAEIERVSCPLKAGTLIVSRMNTPELVGAAGLVKVAPENIYLPDRLWQVSFTNAVPAFVHYWTQSVFYRAQIRVVCAGTSSSMQNLGQDQFRTFDFPNPPQEEQQTITAFLDSETAKFDTLAAEANRVIKLLQERRSALISAAVTGKIDVRSISTIKEAA